MECTRKCNVSVLTIYPEPTFPKSWIHSCKHHTFQTSHEDPLTPRPPEVAARCPVPVPSPAEAVVVSAAGRGGGRRAGLPDTRPTRPPRPLALGPSSLGPGPHTLERNNRIYSPPPPPPHTHTLSEHPHDRTCKRRIFGAAHTFVHFAQGIRCSKI